jgi:large subunit ribosomal protein L3
MLDAIFATKLGMTQAWLKSGKRLAVTKCKADSNMIVGQQETSVTDKSSRTWNKNRQTVLEVGFGTKKLKNMKKPLRNRMTKSGFSFGAQYIQGVRYDLPEESPLKAGDSVSLEQVLAVGDVVKVQGVSKGRGFAGAMKRYGFHGGPATHGQSDRSRAVGSIGSGTTPGRVWKGKRMPGHYGVETKTVSGLVVLHIDPETKEVWLSGPVPGFNTSVVKIEKTGHKKSVELDLAAMGMAPAEAEEKTAAADTAEVSAAAEPAVKEEAAPAEETKPAEETAAANQDKPAEEAPEKSTAESAEK